MENCDTAHRLVVFWDHRAGGAKYRWRLRSATGESIASSATGLPDRAALEREVAALRERYPDTVVRDLTA